VDAGHDVTLLASGGSRTRARLWSVFQQPPSEQLGDVYVDVPHWMRAYRTREQFDVLHDHSGIVGAALGALVSGPPVVHTVHGPWAPHVAVAYLSLPPTLNLVAISHDQARRAPEGLRLAAVISNGVDVTSFPFRADPRTRGGYLAFVGRANPDKGPDVAINVARRLKRRLVMALKVNEPPEERYWDRVLRPLLDGVDVDVRMNSSAKDAADVFAGAEATLVPLSWDEPFGLVMAESMACGTPVVAYARGAADEIVAHGETGYLVEPGDIDGLCDAVARVPDLSPWACRTRVRQLFSAQTMVDAYEALYERLLGDCGGVRAPPVAAQGPVTSPAARALEQR
jgi:glycosyltransferase involved in cell wall biosynthesis